MQLMTVISKGHLAHLPHVNLFLQHNRYIIFETTFKVEPCGYHRSFVHCCLATKLTKTGDSSLCRKLEGPGGSA